MNVTHALKWQSVEKISRIAISFLSATLVLNFLMPENYSKIMGVVLLYNVSLNFLAKAFKAQFINSYREAHSVRVNIIILIVIMTLLINLSLYLFRGLLPDLYNIKVAALIFISSIFLPFSYLRYGFEYRYEFKELYVVEFTSFFILNILRVALVYFEIDTTLVIATYTLEAMAQTIITIVIMFRVRNTQNKILIQHNQVVIRSLIKTMKYMLPYLLIAIIAMSYGKIDQFLILYYFEQVDSGQYFAAIRIYEFGAIIMMIFSNAMYPSLVRANSSHEVGEVHIKMYAMSILSAFSLMFFVHLLAPAINFVFFNNGYEKSIGILKVLSIVYLFTFVGQAWSAHPLSQGKSKTILYSSIMTIFVIYICVFAACKLGRIEDVPLALLIGNAICIFFNFMLTGINEEIRKIERALNLLFVNLLKVFRNE